MRLANSAGLIASPARETMGNTMERRGQVAATGGYRETSDWPSKSICLKLGLVLGHAPALRLPPGSSEKLINTTLKKL